MVLVLAVLLYLPAGIINKPVTLYFSRLKEQFVAIDKTIFYLSLTKCDLLPVRIKPSLDSTGTEFLCPNRNWARDNETTC